MFPHMKLATLPVLLSRHPQVADAEGVCYGRKDMTLMAGWEPVAAGLLTLAKGIGSSVIYTSPSSRCLAVGQKMAERSGLPVLRDDRLQELYFGCWEGLAWGDIPRQALDRWAADPEGFSPPGGESGKSLRERVQSFWSDLLRVARPALVISHGGPLRLLDGLARGIKQPDLLAPSMPQGSSRLYYVSV
ncbi:histidine phosphatase family protein [Gluconobacter japonicus]|uniref:histidine phosphatase family protein n=1 Tax=Gluconobacter japonicus TaxID=376620 RepID=UPI000782B766|nr:histidine phosphatase family protein [Gluconobacter japonicus]KXV20340.1 phosphoglycerate mutase [Gluconobacter japonicus]